MVKKFYFILFLCCFLGAYHSVSAQIDMANPSQINVDSLSDNQILEYWERAKAQGYTIADIESMARMRKMPELQISKLKNRIQKLSSRLKNSNEDVASEKNTSPEEEKASQEEIFGLSGEEIKRENTKNKVFGYDFFRNPKISFAPNLNMPTPENYIISTGDELQVEVWGAAESKTIQKVDNQGDISLEMIGKVRVGGLSFLQAKERIKSALRQIYAGITAPEGSYAKVYVGVSVANVRTVKVNIIGEVVAPGTYSLSALSTVLNALYACGGPTEMGTFRNVKLVRNGKAVATFDIYDFLLTGSQEGNLNLKDQDVILVSPYENQVEVTGSVKREGLYEVKEGEKLSDLARYFGGFLPNAYKDNLVVERIVGAKREVKEVPYNQSESFIVKNGDRLMVHTLTDVYQNRISIAGAVYQPGNYAFSEGLSINDLIERAAGVLKNAYLDRGVVFRLNDGVDKKAISFSVKDVLNKKQSILLQSNDSVYVFFKDSLIQKPFLTIEGAVKTPKKVSYMQGMKVEDLIVMADGFQEGADSETIHISRQINDGNFNRISEVFEVSLSPDMTVSSNSFELQPNDIVTVRLKKGYTQQQLVSIQGEVQLPGVYTIETKQDRISDLIEKAGGFSPFAYVKGASLLRKKVEVSEKKQDEKIKDLRENNEFVLQEKDQYFVGIDLEQIMKNKKSKHNLLLREGDVLTIPSEKQTVEVKGEVLSPSMVRYSKGKSARSYINSAGGFANDAKKRSIYVVYANGDVRGTRNFLFFNSYPKVAPGAVIVVPEKPERKGLTTTETVSITTALTTLAILIYNTFK